MHITDLLLKYRQPLFEGESEGGSGGGSGDDQGGGDGGSGGEGGDEGKSKINIGLKKPSDEGDDGNSGDDGAGDGGNDDPSKPEGLAAKFWDSDKGEVRTDVLTKSYAELEAAHGKLRRDKTIGGEVPENATDYFDKDFKLDESVDRIALENGIDDPGLQAWGEVCKKYDIGKELAVNLAQDMFMVMNDKMPEVIDPEQEREALGKGADAIVEGVQTWAEGLEAGKRISDDDAEIINDLSKTAQGIKFLVRMREMTGEQRIPLVDHGGKKQMSQSDWKEAMKAAVKKEDYARQKELDDISADIFGNAPSHGGSGGGVNPDKNLRSGTK